MTRDDLAAALAVCGFVCVECGTDQVRIDHAPKLGLVPVVMHWQTGPGEWCPALSGGAAARLASVDLLDALAAVVPLSQYGEPEPWHRREKVTA